MNDSIAGENSLAYVRSSCAEGHRNNRLNAWSKFLRKSAISWKKVSRGIKFAIPISSVEFAGVGRTGAGHRGEKSLSSRSLLLKSVRSPCQDRFAKIGPPPWSQFATIPPRRHRHYPDLCI